MTGLEELENRLQRLEDERDIARLIASYGPLVDAAEPDGTSDLWTDDGVYDVDGWKLNGRSRIGEMVRSGAHQTLVAGGCCHFLGPCVVTLPVIPRSRCVSR